MAPIFTSSDISALVAAFPPPLPTKNRPSLVKSRSGNNLLDSRKALARFRVLLETNPGRIKKADLPARLGIDGRSDWLLDCYDEELFYGKDTETLITVQEAQNLVERIKAWAADKFVDVGDLASSLDVSRQSCDRLIALVPNLRYFSKSRGGQLVGDDLLVRGLSNQISSEIEHANGEKVHLTSSFASVPASVLVKLAEETLEERGDGGSLSREDERVLYVPADFESLQEKKREELHQSRLDEALNDLATGGFCEIPTREDLGNDILPRFREEHSDAQLTIFSQTGENVQVVATMTYVHEAMKELDDILRNAVRNGRDTDRTSTSLNQLESLLCDETSHLGLTERLLKSSEHRRLLEASLASAVIHAEDEEGKRFERICRNSFVAPLELYSQGLLNISDQTLKDRLDQYICEHVQNETLPCFTRALGGLNLSKARAKELDKLNSVVAQAKTVKDFQSAARKYCRKQKIAMPDAASLHGIKREVLQAKLKSMQKMSRASDVLQNLVWILLAQQHDGLFLSAGKDTTRMIRLVGDAERRQKLEHWRDLLKAGSQSDVDVQQMKDLAAEAIESMYVGHAAQQNE